MSEPTKSPLSEASPSSLSRIFSEDPLNMTRQDRDQVVKELRRAREGFEIEDAKPKASKRSKLETVQGKVDLADLGL